MNQTFMIRFEPFIFNGETIFFFLFEVVDFGNFLHDERCWGVDCGNKCLGEFPDVLVGCAIYHMISMSYISHAYLMAYWYREALPASPRELSTFGLEGGKNCFNE